MLLLSETPTYWNLHMPGTRWRLLAIAKSAVEACLLLNVAPWPAVSLSHVMLPEQTDKSLAIIVLCNTASTYHQPTFAGKTTGNLPLLFQCYAELVSWLADYCYVARGTWLHCKYRLLRQANIFSCTCVGWLEDGQVFRQCFGPCGTCLSVWS